MLAFETVSTHTSNPFYRCPAAQMPLSASVSTVTHNKAGNKSLSTFLTLLLLNQKYWKLLVSEAILHNRVKCHS
jgi:hypothetical protein